MRIYNESMNFFTFNEFSESYNSKVTYQYNCISPSSLDDLNFIIDGLKPISRIMFTKKVDRESRLYIETMLGYSRSFPICKDWHVSYFQSRTLNGKTAYILSHSGIEYIFY